MTEEFAQYSKKKGTHVINIYKLLVDSVYYWIMY